MISEHMKENALKATPTRTLFDCLDLSNSFGIYEGEPQELCRTIKKNFAKAIELYNEKQFGFIREVIPLMADKNGIIEELPDYFYTFYINKFVYLFYWEDKFYIVMPDELIAIYQEKINEKGFMEINSHNQEMAIYARALLNLHGIYEIEQFVWVWNQHHKNKINYAEAERFLSDLSEFHSDYYIDENWVIHECIFSDDDFDELFETVKDSHYFMPPKSVITVYGADDFEYDEIPEVRKICDFLVAYISDERNLDDLQLEISLSFYRYESPSQIRKYLNDRGFPLNDVEAVAKFEKLYQVARENVHVWEFHGRMPRQYELTTGKTLKRFELPKNKK